MKLNIVNPLPGELVITFPFGAATDWYLKQFGYPHNGVDLRAQVGTPVFAVSDGTVIYNDDIADADGMGIILEHYWGRSLYWHLSKITVRIGEKVTKGQEIGKSGATGFVTGPHFHFGMKVQGDAPEGMHGWSDPMKYLKEAPISAINEAKLVQHYRVQRGDSLWKISEKLYGIGTRWQEIFDLNKEQIKDPDLIYPDQILTIP